jgi:RNA polymerase sigma-70 factor (ECF subfamily)
MTPDKSRANEDIQALIPSAESPGQFNEVVLALEAKTVQQVSQGDKNALITLYENHIDRVYRYLYSKVGNVAEAKDLTTETFTQAIEALMNGQYVWQGKPIGTWLFTIANDVLQERDHRLNNLPHLENIDSLLESVEPITQKTTISDTLIQKEEKGALWDLVKQLPLVEQEVLIMRHVYGLPYSEIARRLQRGEHASKQLHYRALTKLKRLVQSID